PPVVTLNVPPAPTVNVTAFALVNDGASFTVNVNDCVAGAPTPLVAVIVSAYAPPVPADGVPARAARPLPLSGKEAAPGSVRVLVIAVTAGPRVVVIAKPPATPTVNVVAAALVMAAPWFTVIVNACVAFTPTPLAAVIVIGNVPLENVVPARVAVPL